MSFEKLRVYQAAELMQSLVEQLLERAPGVSAKDADQLRRASASVPYNIAEAFGSEHPGQKIYHLGIARGSADETRAILRKLAKTGALSPATATRPSILARTVAKMLTSWIDALREKPLDDKTD
ncbi:MAG TPA: four helix bundle protein [Longimicrobiales bacterium]